MSYIYVFGKNEDDNDYSSMGLVGALLPTECTFTETANGESTIEMNHPIDDFGRYLYLQKGNILVVPVPVRTTPEIQNGSIVTRVWKYKIKPLAQLTSKSQRTLYKKRTGSGKKKIMPAGTELTVVQKYQDEDSRWKVKTKYGTGWVYGSGLTDATEVIIGDSSQSIEEVQSPWTVTPQYFRICEKDSTIDGIAIRARHISYDLLYNSTKYETKNSVTLQTALDGILNNTSWAHEFEAFTNVANERAGLFYKKKNPINVFLDPEEGVCKLFDVDLIRDNYSLYFLHDPGINRGVRVQYRKNMIGVDFRDSDEEVATRIYPIGEKKDGTDLYLTDNGSKDYIDVSDVISSWINPYPYPHDYYLECENCKVGDKDPDGSTITTSTARSRMSEQATNLINSDCYKPKVEMSIDFLNLGDTEEYAQFKNLENCFLFDYIIVQHPELEIDVTAQIVEFQWDCILDRMKSVQIGSIGKTIANAGITTWQIPSGFSGAKIANDTIGSGAIKSDIINARHLQSESVNTENLVAQSITSEKIAAQAVKTENLDAEAVTTNKLAAHAITTDKISAGAVTAQTIGAGAVTADKVTAGAIDAKILTVDYAKVKGALNSEQLITKDAIAEKYYMEKLFVKNMQAISSTIGNLVIKASDNKYYRLDVANGEVTYQQVTPTSSEIAAGETSTGQSIIETSLTVDDLAASTVKAMNALIDKITASRIEVDTLVAREEFVQTLYTSQIFGGKSIQIIAGDAETAQSIATAAQNDIDNLSVGGRNYIRNSRSLTNARQYFGEPGIYNTSVYDNSAYA